MLYSNARKESSLCVTHLLYCRLYLPCTHSDSLLSLWVLGGERHNTKAESVLRPKLGAGVGDQTLEEMETGEAVWKRAAFRCTKRHTAVFSHL